MSATSVPYSKLVCRLCIKQKNTFHPIDYIKKCLETILPNLDLSLTKNPVVVCSNCAALATQCYNFVTMCMEKNEIVQNYYNKIHTVDLDLLPKNSTKTTPDIINKSECEDLPSKSTSLKNESMPQECESNNIVEIVAADIFSDVEISDAISTDTPFEEIFSHEVNNSPNNKESMEKEENDDIKFVNEFHYSEDQNQLKVAEEDVSEIPGTSMENEGNDEREFVNEIHYSEVPGTIMENEENDEREFVNEIHYSDAPGTSTENEGNDDIEFGYEIHYSKDPYTSMENEESDDVEFVNEFQHTKIPLKLQSARGKPHGEEMQDHRNDLAFQQCRALLRLKTHLYVHITPKSIYKY